MTTILEETEKTTKERVSITCFESQYVARFHTRRKFTKKQVKYISTIDGVTDVSRRDDKYTINISFGPAFEWSEIGGEVLYAIASMFGVSIEELDVTAEKQIGLREDTSWLARVCDIAKEIELEELEGYREFIEGCIHLADRAAEALREERDEVEKRLAKG